MEKQKNVYAHLAYLDGLRAAAALYVVVHHSTLQFKFLAEDTSTFTQIFLRLFSYGHYAVNLFIILSGFCLMLPVVRAGGTLRDTTWVFLKKRARRILPPYYLAMALSLVLVVTYLGEKTNSHWDMSIPVTNWDMVTHLLLIQDLFENSATKINHTFWSISVEWRIYLLFPLLVVFYNKAGALVATVIILIASLIGWMLLSYTDVNLRSHGLNPQYFGLFCLGTFSAYISFSSDVAALWLRRRIGWVQVVVIVIISKFLFLLGNYLKMEGLISEIFPINDVIFGLFIYLFLSWLALGKLNLIRRIFSFRPIVFIGGFAYSIYLVHAPLIQLIWLYIIPRLNLSPISSMVFLVTAGTLAIMGFSYVFYRVAERPFINKKIPAKEIEPALA